MKLKHLIGVAGATAFLVAWSVVAAALAIGVDKMTWTILVTIAAFATEAFIWCLAAMLGLSVFDARRKIWRWMTTPLRRSA